MNYWTTLSDLTRTTSPQHFLQAQTFVHLSSENSNVHSIQMPPLQKEQ